jgi:hypothetical protein
VSTDAHVLVLADRNRNLVAGVGGVASSPPAQRGLDVFWAPGRT